MSSFTVPSMATPPSAAASPAWMPYTSMPHISEQRVPMPFTSAMTSECAPSLSTLSKMSRDMRKEIENIFQQAGCSMHAMQIVKRKFQKFVDDIRDELPTNQRSKFEEIEGFTGCTIPYQVNILPPKDHLSKGRVKKIRGHSDKGGSDKKKTEAKKKRKMRRFH
ncbi:hypothetical protein EJB05_07051, partial [Eragrostis curvula]